ncbi:MAG: hypothetical protein P4L50_00115 [Anaerolineaceae bacterium]|nr:hypothetical protein [Anaerolineaceae bacterium]
MSVQNEMFTVFVEAGKALEELPKVKDELAQVYVYLDAELLKASDLAHKLEESESRERALKRLLELREADLAQATFRERTAKEAINAIRGFLAPTDVPVAGGSGQVETPAASADTTIVHSVLDEPLTDADIGIIDAIYNAGATSIDTPTPESVPVERNTQDPIQDQNEGQSVEDPTTNGNLIPQPIADLEQVGVSGHTVDVLSGKDQSEANPIPFPLVAPSTEGQSTEIVSSNARANADGYQLEVDQGFEFA